MSPAPYPARPALRPALRPAAPPTARPAARPAAPPSTPVQRLTEQYGPWLTVTEVAALLKVSKMTVYRLTEIAELGSIRVGRSVRIPERSVQLYLDAGGSDQDLYTPAPRRRRPLVRVTR